ncbi:chaplin family protein, partial [Arthrobacter koreensis]|uniref:chaplin family protein n=1 Tax=Arthrobacter koreensis TaxID=199136 RepID=UPI003ABE7839
MRCTIRRGLLGTLFAGGLLALGTTAANAEPVTSGSDGLLSGTQITAPITIPINLGTNSLAILGEANTETTSEAATPGMGTETGTPAAGTGPVTSGPATSGSDGILSGTQITAPITIPVNLGTNSLAILGEANTETTSEAATPAADTAIGTPAAGTEPVTSGSGGLLSGTQITAPITIPVDLGTNSLAVLGEANTETTSEAATPAADT